MSFIPARFWLLLLVAFLAYPALGVVVRRTIGLSLPGVSFVDRRDTRIEQRQLVRSVVWLIALTVFAIFIFTQAAVDFVHSPTFLPLVMVGGTGMGLYYTLHGAVTGSVEPLVKGGGWGPYDRMFQPKRYWMSLLWNSVLTTICAFLIFKV